MPSAAAAGLLHGYGDAARYRASIGHIGLEMVPLEREKRLIMGAGKEGMGDGGHSSPLTVDEPRSERIL